MKKLVLGTLMTALLSAPFLVTAGPDEKQRMTTQQLMQAKHKLAAAQAAQGAERQKLMSEHMTMMQKTMTQLIAMKPRNNMTPEEQKDWIAEHQKLMDSMMGQMMDEHHLMMQANCK